MRWLVWRFRGGHGSKVILLSPFTSLVAVARLHAPWLPAGWLMRNRYDSARKAPAIEVPVAIFHGTEDSLIPLSMGERLAALFPRAEVFPCEGLGHGGLLYSQESRVREWLQR